MGFRIIRTNRGISAADKPKPFAEVSCNLVTCNTSKMLAVGNNQLKHIVTHHIKENRFTLLVSKSDIAFFKSHSQACDKQVRTAK
jgi:hypothetical protein